MGKINNTSHTEMAFVEWQIDINDPIIVLRNYIRPIIVAGK